MISNSHPYTRLVNSRAQILLLAAMLAAFAVSMLSAVASAAPTAAGVDIPPGQLKRQGLFGTVVDKHGGSIYVSTKWGNVEVQIIDGITIINAPPLKNVGMDAIQIGSRVAVSLMKGVPQSRLAAIPPATTPPAATRPAATRPAAIRLAMTQPAATRLAAIRPAATRPAAIRATAVFRT